MLVSQVSILQGLNYWSDVVKWLVHKLYEAGWFAGKEACSVGSFEKKKKKRLFHPNGKLAKAWGKL